MFEKSISSSSTTCCVKAALCEHLTQQQERNIPKSGCHRWNSCLPLSLPCRSKHALWVMMNGASFLLPGSQLPTRWCRMGCVTPFKWEASSGSFPSFGFFSNRGAAPDSQRIRYWGWRYSSTSWQIKMSGVRCSLYLFVPISSSDW